MCARIETPLITSFAPDPNPFAHGRSDSINAHLRDTPADTDTVTCGAGDDVVVADENDTVAVDCERIRVVSSAARNSYLTPAPHAPATAGS